MIQLEKLAPSDVATLVGLLNGATTPSPSSRLPAVSTRPMQPLCADRRPTFW